MSLKPNLQVYQKVVYKLKFTMEALQEKIVRIYKYTCQINFYNITQQLWGLSRM